MKWTKEQQNVIDFRNRDILVSAAAGSGKTAVLVARIIQRILDPQNPVDIDRLLVVTFTKAAAAEMRERIGAAIEAECEKDPQNTHLRRQSALIHNAMITTIDSFCLFVVRNHFEEISLDPNFRIADEGEIRLLEQDVLEQVFEDNYARQEKTFLSLIDAYAGKRNDHGVREMVAKIYRMSLSSPWPQAWMKKLTEPYQVEHAQELVQTEMLEDIAEHARLLLCDMCTQMTQALQLCNEPDGPQAYAKTLEADLTQLQQAENLQGYLQVQTFLNGLVFGKLSPIRKFSGDVQKKETVMEIRSDVKKEVETLQKKYFAMDLETLLLQQKRLCPFLEELVRLALEYTQAMETAKRKKRIVDFADIEHFALRILVDEKTKQPRHTAEEFRRHFAEIMIDEYQDSNQVQEEIMRAISMEPEGGHNLFMVGDVNDDAQVAEAEDGSVLGYLITASSTEGYNGLVQISVGITSEGNLTGLGFLSISETPGLGMKAKEPDFKDQFNGMKAQKLEVTKTDATADNQVQAISGATYTSKAVTGATNAAIYFVENCVGK